MKIEELHWPPCSLRHPKNPTFSEVAARRGDLALGLLPPPPAGLACSPVQQDACLPSRSTSASAASAAATRTYGPTAWRCLGGQRARCQRPGANRLARPPTGGHPECQRRRHQPEREMTSFFIFHCSVERLRPSRDAAPSGPPPPSPYRAARRECVPSPRRPVWSAAAVGSLA